MKQAQDKKLLEVYQACCRTGHELLLEIILPSTMEQKESYYLDVVRHLYQLGIKPDWWKLPGLKAVTWQQLTAVISANDPYCRGVLILGLDAPESIFDETFKEAANADIVKGFAVGRTIFAEASAKWLANEINDDVLMKSVREKYQRLIHLWKKYKG